MNMHKIIELSATEIISKLKRREVSAVEVAQAFMNRIAEVNPDINAIEQIYPEQVLKSAHKADRALSNRETIGKLHGLPFTVKDTCQVQGFICSKGFRPFYGKPAEKDATIIGRLKAEGAFVLALTNVPELLMSFESDNPIYGRVNNPYDLSKIAGGSSGGEAAILAACGSPLGIGSDAGGSIRQPAHLCGIAGLKPTQHLLPLTGDVPYDGYLGWIRPLLTYGPMARYVEDLALALDVMAGPDGFDPDVPPVPVKDFRQVDISKLKVAFYLDNGIAAIEPEIRSLLTEAISNLKSKVASVTECQPECLKESFFLLWETIFLGGDEGVGFKRFFEKTSYRYEDMSPLLKERMKMQENSHFSVDEIHRRMIMLEQFRLKMLEAFREYDVVLSPVAAAPAIPHGTSFAQVKKFSYTMPYNLTGWPALSVPVGKTETGLPVGIQIATKPWCDHVALAIGMQFEKFTKE